MKKIWLTVCAVLAAGSMTAAFAACNTTDGEDEHEHNLSFVAAVDATCTEDGHKAYYECDGCDKIFADAEGENEITLDSTVVEALGHDVEQVAAVEATCTTDGNIAYYECKVCHELFEDEEATKPIDEADTVIAAKHDFINVPAKEATCTAEGNIAYYECKVCHELFKDADATEGIEKEDTVVAKKAHTPETISGKAATCTETGLTDGSKCSVCGTILKEQEVISANGHSPAAAVKENEKAATCTAQGSYDEVVYCSVCHAEISRAEKTTPKAAHDLNAVAAKDATCTTDGNIAYYECKTCHELFEDEEATKPIDKADTVIAAKHDLVNVPAKDATCTAEGNIAYYECKVCHELFNDADATEGIEKEDTVVAKKAHTPETIPGKAATCTETGLTDGSKCSVCGTILEEQAVIPVKEHTLAVAAVTTEPTAEADGKATLKCVDCDYTEDMTLPALTEENVDNGTYNYSIVYRFEENTNAAYFYKDKQYILTDNKYDISAFVIKSTATSERIQSPSAMMVDLSSSPASGSIVSRYLSGNTSLDSARYGAYLKNSVKGTYKIILPEELDVIVTLIGSDGTVKDLITVAGQTEAKFTLADDVNYMIVLHSAATRTDIEFTIEESEDIILSLTQTCQTGNLEGGDMRGTTPGGSVTITIGEGVAEGTYKIHLGGSVLFGRNYNFKIIVNGTDEYTTGMNMPNQTGGTGASANITVKTGDVLVITNYNGQAMSGTVTLYEVQ